MRRIVLFCAALVACAQPPPRTPCPACPKPAPTAAERPTAERELHEAPSALARAGDGYIAHASFPDRPPIEYALDFRAGTARAMVPDAAPVPIVRVVVDGTTRRFELEGQPPTVFELQYEGYAEVMHGEVQRGTERGTFDVVRAAPGGDGWLGGFALPGTTTGRYLAIDFFAGTARLGPDDPPLPIHMTMTTPTNVRFDLKTPKEGLFVFEAPVERTGAMKGTVVHGSARVPFELTLARPYDRNAARRYEGTYVAAGHTVRVGSGGAGLGMFDTSDGSVRRLHATGPDAFVIGPSLSGTAPWTADVTFAFDKGAKSATRLVVKGRDGRTIEARRQDYRTEELRFKSGAITLAGTLYLPPGNGPFPAVVDVHGSGRATRDDTWPQAMARVFLEEGVAVFLYDKRGVAESEGDYVPGPTATNNVGPENLERLASDARAAAATLAARKDIAKVGLYGISQAGWIMPLAAASSKDVKFMVVASGPLVPTSLEALWSELLGDGERAATMSLEQADAVMRKAPRAGFNSAPYAAKLDIPVLWAYGELDTSIPVRECLRAFEEIRAGHDFEAVTFKNAGHALYEVGEDVEAENAFSRGFAPGFLDKVRAWLRAHVTRAR